MGNSWLKLGGVGAYLGGLLHVAALIGGPSWIAYIGAPDFAVQSAQQGTWIAPVGAFVIAGLMWLCSAYAFAGAGLLWRFPLLRTGLFAIAFVFTARGIILVPIAIRNPEILARVGTFEISASLVWLSIGLSYGIGLYNEWNRLGGTSESEHKTRTQT